MIKDRPIATSHAEIIIMKKTINCESKRPVDFEKSTKSNPTPDSINSKHSRIEIKSFLKTVPNKPKQNKNAAKK
jgi:hypothetical protein